MKENRIQYIDIMKALGIILVIIGHISYKYFNFGIKKYIYAFHMPIFFFIIGILYYKKKLDYNFSKFILKKFHTLLIPYILWTLIYASFSVKNLFYIFYGSHNFLMNNINSTLWFLPCYFITVIMFEFILRFINKIRCKYIYIYI